MSSEEKCRCFSPCNSSMHAVNLKTFCGCEFCFLLRTGCIKEILILTFIPHSIKLLIEKCSNLTPALNTIRNRHYSTIGEFDQFWKENFVRLQFNQQTHYLLLEVVLLQRCISLIRTKWHSPQSPPQDTPKKKKKKKRKEERVLVGALIFRTLCTSMMSKLTPCVLIITLVKMTNNYQRLYTKMNFRLSSYIFLGRQLQRYWILSRPL